MSRSINKVTLIGTVGRDPEMRFTPGGSGIANFSMATNESYNDKNTGQRVENNEWHRIVAFGKLAEIIQQYVKKGSKLYIEGKLRTNEWEKDGIKRYSTDVIANEMVMLDRANADGQNSSYANHQQGQAGSPYGAALQPYANQQAPAPQQHQQQRATPPPGYIAPQQPQHQHQQSPHQQPAPQVQHSNQFDGPDRDIPF